MYELDVKEKTKNEMKSGEKKPRKICRQEKKRRKSFYVN